MLGAALVRLFSFFDIDHGNKDAGPSCGTPVGRVSCLQFTTHDVKFGPICGLCFSLGVSFAISNKIFFFA